MLGLAPSRKPLVIRLVFCPETCSLRNCPPYSYFHSEKGGLAIREICQESDSNRRRNVTALKSMKIVPIQMLQTATGRRDISLALAM
jgi:hypothetical protein